MTWYFFAPIFFIITIVCAGVGLGGGTAYLSVLALWNTDPGVLRPLAWTFNVLAAGVGLMNFRAKGHFSLNFAWPFLVGGAVGAAVGARLPITAQFFELLLAVALFGVSLRMLFATDKKDEKKSQTIKGPAWPVGLAIGLLIGVVSGVVGIGGGILLGPVILSFKWAPVKTSAATTSAYILVSSVGALGAFFAGGGTVDPKTVAVLGSVVLVGGFAGSRYGAGKADPRLVMRILGALIFLVSIKLFWAVYLQWG